ncbi:MAG: hypothetical protein ACHQEB_07255 [Chitinophagales bacterium]
MASGTGSPGGHPLKNIAIGVATTVLASSIVYLLFHDSGDKDDLKKAKQATVEAWESLMTYERSFKNAGTRMVCSGDMSAMAKDIVSEYQKIIDNIANIKEEKKDKADNRIISLIDRRLLTLKDKKDETSDYYKKLDDLEASDLTRADKDSMYIVEENDFVKRIGTLETRDTDFVSEINADLKKKYHVEFKFPPPLQVSPELVTANWSLDRDSDLQLKKDKTFSWKKDKDSYSGKWSLNDLSLRFDFSDGSSLEYTITGGSETVIMMKQVSNNSLHFLCRN